MYSRYYGFVIFASFSQLTHKLYLFDLQLCGSFRIHNLAFKSTTAIFRLYCTFVCYMTTLQQHTSLLLVSVCEHRPAFHLYQGSKCHNLVLLYFIKWFLKRVTVRKISHFPTSRGQAFA